jgi:biotin carboxyl carrier protein
MRRYRFKVEGRDVEVDLTRMETGRATVSVEGRTYEVEIETGSPVAPAAAQTRPAAPRPAAPRPATHGSDEIRAPMPGMILDVSVQPGDAVAARQPVIRMETMKMENEVRSPRDGVVKSVLVRRDQDVEQGQVLVTLEE